MVRRTKGGNRDVVRQSHGQAGQCFREVPGGPGRGAGAGTGRRGPRSAAVYPGPNEEQLCPAPDGVREGKTTLGRRAPGREGKNGRRPAESRGGGQGPGGSGPKEGRRPASQAKGPGNRSTPGREAPQPAPG